MDHILEHVEELIEAGTFELPAIPEVAQKAIQISRSEEATISELVSTIEHEPVICSSLISVVNSPVMRSAVDIKDLPTAIARLGMPYTCSYVIGISLQHAFSASTKLGKQIINHAWMRSNQIAEIAALFASKHSPSVTHEAVFAGLIHNIGELAVTRYIEEEAPFLLEEWANTISRFNISARIGDLAISEWGLPREIHGLCEKLVNGDPINSVSIHAVKCALLWHLEEISISAPSWMDCPSVLELGLPIDLGSSAFKELVTQVKQINPALDVNI